MTIEVEISNDIEQRLRDQAQAAGLGVDRYVVKLIEAGVGAMENGNGEASFFSAQRLASVQDVGPLKTAAVSTSFWPDEGADDFVDSLRQQRSQGMPREIP